MKLRNKKTGEIGCLVCSFEKTPERITVVEYIDGKRGSRVWHYDTLAKLNAEWEDYEDPKEYWYIDTLINEVTLNSTHIKKDIESDKEIGNYFETKEEAEKAAKKLKAWKRLKDKGFKFEGYTDDSGDLFSCQVIRCSFDDFGSESKKDLDLLFGGKE